VTRCSKWECSADWQLLEGHRLLFKTRPGESLGLSLLLYSYTVQTYVSVGYKYWACSLHLLKAAIHSACSQTLYTYMGFWHKVIIAATKMLQVGCLNLSIIHLCLKWRISWYTKTFLMWLINTYMGFSCSRLRTRLHSVALSTFVIKLLRPALVDLNPSWRPYEVRRLFC